MKILVACERSGVVRDAFRGLGHDAWSCDLVPSESFELVKFTADMPFCECCGEEAWCSEHHTHFADCNCLGPTMDNVIYQEREDKLYGSAHYQTDVLNILEEGWDLMIAHPDCTYLASSGLHWNKRIKGREEKTRQAMEFVLTLLSANIDRIALENPIGRIGTAYRKADQIIQPYMFGHPEAKATCLWLKNLPKLQPTNLLLPKNGDWKRGWSNQTPSGQNKLGPSPTRAMKRARTYQGIAHAMAQQWGNLPC